METLVWIAAWAGGLLGIYKYFHSCNVGGSFIICTGGFMVLFTILLFGFKKVLRG